MPGATVDETLFEIATGTFAGLLRSLSGVLEKGAEEARSEGRDPDSLLEARLAADMFPLTRQVQIACDHAVAAVSRLQGREPPSVPDQETTLAELQARIGRTVGIVEAVKSGDLQGGAARRIVIPLVEDLVFDGSGLEYLRDWALPHFYFHVATAYDILRHEGTPIGKRDYMAHIGPRIRPK